MYVSHFKVTCNVTDRVVNKIFSLQKINKVFTSNKYKSHVSTLIEIPNKNYNERTSSFSAFCRVQSLGGIKLKVILSVLKIGIACVASVSNRVIARKLERKRQKMVEGEGRRGNACPQTPRFGKTPLDISRFGSFVN